MTATNPVTRNMPEYVISRILADGVDRRKVKADAASLISFSQHLDNEVQQQYSVKTQGGDFFIKRWPCSEQALERASAETEGLLRILTTNSVSTALPLYYGDDGESIYLVLKHLPLAVHGDWKLAGRQIAEMHSSTTSKGYGYDSVTFCGDTRLDNSWNASWTDFYLTQRLQPLLRMLNERGDLIGYEDKVLSVAERRLNGHQPAASLLHGDLWSGNIGFIPDTVSSRPVIFDPGCFYGDAETDLAMTELFGRFPQAFYTGYQEVREVAEEYTERRAVYQLFHLLNHAVLFGGHYLIQSRDAIARM